MPRMRLGAAIKLLVLGIVAPMVACETTSPAGGDPANSQFGLRADENVNLAFPEETPRIRYINAVRTNAPWLATQGEYVSFPRAVAVDDALNRIYISEQHGVRTVDLTTGELGLMASGVQLPHGIAVGPDGNVFIADARRGSVEVYTSDDKFVRRIGGFREPKGIAIDQQLQRLYVADGKSNEVSAYSLEGRFLFKLNQSAESPLALPLAVAVNSEGLVYVLNWSAPYVQIFDTNGNFVRGFGTNGTWPSQFVMPKGIAIDGDDNVYVADAAFGNVQIFDSQDRLALFFGRGGDAPGEFNIPGMLAIDAKNRLFVPEYGSHRVQVYEYLSQ